MMPVRVSIKSYLIPYLDAVGKEIGTPDRSEIVNHLLRESKRRGATTDEVSNQHSALNTPTDDDDLANSLLDFMPA